MTDTELWAEFASDEANDREAEAAVLGSCLIDPTLLDEIALSREDFYVPSHAIVWDAMQTMHAEDRKIDAITLAGYLADAGTLTKIGGGPYLHGLLDAALTPSNGPYYATRVKKMARRRAVAAFAATAARISRGTDEDAMVDELRRALEAIEGDQTETGPVHWSEVIEQGMAAIDRASAGEAERGIPTGLVDLDAVIGGFMPGDVAIIAGRPGSGKSVLAAQIAAHAALDLELPALLVSLEMRIPELYNRIAASRLGINLGNFTSGVLSDQEASKLARQAGISAECPLWIEDNPGHTVASIAATARKFKRRHGLSLLVVDYLQLITPPRAENRQVAVSEISRGLKLLAAQLEIPIIMAAQLNRGPESRGGKIPALGDLRESGSLENDASIVLLMHREAASDPNSLRQGEADVIVAKNRNGAQATVPVAAQLHFARFASMAGADKFGRP